MARYATNTTVSVEKSQQEIQTILRKYGADTFGVMENKTTAFLMFQYNNLAIQIQVPLPDRKDFLHTETGRSRKQSQIDEAYNQAIRQRWRALVIAVKAKLEVVELGISTLEKEFLSYIRMPNGQELGDHLIPQLNALKESGTLPQLTFAG